MDLLNIKSRDMLGLTVNRTPFELSVVTWELMFRQQAIKEFVCLASECNYVRGGERARYGDLLSSS
jgi:hypothetical protein